MEAFGNMVKVLPEPMPQETKSGLIMTGKQASQIRYQAGRVISVGEQVDRVKPDDRVLYDSVQGNDVMLNGTVYRVLEYRHCVGLLAEGESIG